VLLDDKTRAALAARVERLRELARDVTWVAPDNLHVTLKFLGGVEAPRLELIREALDRAVRGHASFDLAIRGLGAFPTPTRARVIWAGIDEGKTELSAIAARVEHEIAPIGFPTEDRAFSPHVTLGRVREPRPNERLADVFAASARESFGVARVERISLMRSDLSPRGARYSEIARHPLC
jgi:RNA 2',3'-cyclic 3'-phosphodiesterase